MQPAGKMHRVKCMLSITSGLGHEGQTEVVFGVDVCVWEVCVYV